MTEVRVTDGHDFPVASAHKEGVREKVMCEGERTEGEGE